MNDLIAPGAVRWDAVNTEERSEADLARWECERRLGKFTISQELMRDEPELARLILASVFVVRCEQLWHLDGLEYVALGEHFEPVEMGQYPPAYTAEISKEDDHTVSFKWVK